jgi:adenylate cyclase
MEDRLPRKLAAILYADVAGYSRLTGEDEDTTHRTLTEYLDVISTTIDSHRGKVMHYAGDAALAKFEAVVDAMSAAVAIQNELNTRNQALPEERKVHFRIGVNSGDVIEDRGDMYGDGVNIAARLESLAEPGGICISDAVRTAVGKKLDLQYEFMGEQEVKNILEPVRAYRVVLWKEKAAVIESVKPALELPDKPSIAVLPFTNMSGDSEQEYFSDGITEDIITELSRFRDLFVIARNSSFVFKNQSVDVAEIGQKLGIRYVVEGSVRKSGKRVRVTAQLIDATTGNHVWGDRYDRELEDIFAVQDEVVRIIASTLVGRVAHAHRNHTQRKPTTNLDAYDWFVQGRELFYNGTPEDNKKACEMFEKAISLDPDYAGAYALLAEAYARDWITFWNEPLETSYDRAWANAKKSITLDNTDSQTRTALGVVFLYSGNYDQAFFHLDKALALNPNDTHALIYMARYDYRTGNTERALERVVQARRNNPFGKYDFTLVPPYYMAHRYDEAINVAQAIPNPASMMLCFLAASYAQAGDIEKAQEVATEFIAMATEKLTSVGTPIPQSWLDFIDQRWLLKQSKDRDHFLDGLRKAGIPD